MSLKVKDTEAPKQICPICGRYTITARLLPNDDKGVVVCPLCKGRITVTKKESAILEAKSAPIQMEEILAFIDGAYMDERDQRETLRGLYRSYIRTHDDVPELVIREIHNATMQKGRRYLCKILTDFNTFLAYMQKDPTEQAHMSKIAAAKLPGFYIDARGVYGIIVGKAYITCTVENDLYVCKAYTVNDETGDFDFPVREPYPMEDPIEAVNTLRSLVKLYRTY